MFSACKRISRKHKHKTLHNLSIILILASRYDTLKEHLVSGEKWNMNESPLPPFDQTMCSTQPQENVLTVAFGEDEINNFPLLCDDLPSNLPNELEELSLWKSIGHEHFVVFFLCGPTIKTDGKGRFDLN